MAESRWPKGLSCHGRAPSGWADSGMRDFRNMRVWRAGYDLARDVGLDVRAFPRDGRWGIGRQMTSSSVSIPSNIAEGAGRTTVGEFLNQLSVANGSACELETQVMLARDWGRCDDDTAAARLASIESR